MKNILKAFSENSFTACVLGVLGCAAVGGVGLAVAATNVALAVPILFAAGIGAMAFSVAGFLSTDKPKAAAP